jgi:hypothetical protein
MRIARLVLVTAALTASAASAATTRTDPGFVYQGLNGPVAPLGGGTACPGDAIAALPFSDPGTTCDNTNTLTNYTGTCTLPFPYGGENAIYQITLAAGNNVTFSADLTGSAGDLALFLITTCGNGATCFDNSEDLIGAGVGPEVIAAASYTPGTYCLYVDSYYAAGNPGSCGTYTLSVTGSLPVELVEFSID